MAAEKRKSSASADLKEQARNPAEEDGQEARSRRSIIHGSFWGES